MSTSDPSVYVTTAIPFVNARPHLGFALELCIADAYARHARARGRPVHFVNGTDDHSLKNVAAAERAGVPPAQFVVKHAAAFRQLLAALSISIDSFISTSQHPPHRPAVHALRQACAARGDLYRAAYGGLYCLGCERFAEPDELQCAEHAAPLERVSEENWFFRLSRYGDLVRERIEAGALRISHDGAREETLALLREPLRDLCVSRSATRAHGWGVPVPGDPDQVIWVWFDALAYYLSALGYGIGDSAFERHWQGDGRRVHVIGKGVTRFHAVFWPAILESAGLRWPSDLWVHGYLTLDGAKISKSGRTLDPVPLIEEFGADALRYYLLRHIRTTRDGDFSRERLERAYDSELASGLGNLINRVLGLVQRGHDCRVPAAGSRTTAIDELQAAGLALPSLIDAAFARCALDEGLHALFELIDTSNRVLDQTAPWHLIRSQRLEDSGAILRALLEVLIVIARELAVYLPGAGRRLHAALAPLEQPSTPACEPWRALATGAPLPPALHLFPRRTGAVS